MSYDLELAFLGNIDIRQNGIPLTGFNSSKSQALLCYLAVTGRPHLRPMLTGLLWGDLPEANARNNLRKALTNLRQLVGPHLTITRQAAAFNQTSSCWLDVTVFEAQVGGGSREADIGRLEEAVELYRGDFLEGFYVRQAPAFEEWVLAEQARLRELVLQALHSLTAFYIGQGEGGLMKGIDYTTRLLALDPWREEAHRQLMLLLARSGQRGAALAQFETCRQVLAEALGVEPGKETTDLHDRIRTGDVSRSAEAQGSQGVEELSPAPPRLSAPRHNLPTQTTPFIGREAEVAELTQLLARPDLRLLTIVGPGGMGKTRLALEVAAVLLDRFEHGVYFVRLGPLTSAQSIVPAIAETLNFSFYRGSSPEEQLRNYLRKKQVLLLMDNFEHLLSPLNDGPRGATIVVDLLKAASSLKILTTSRARLNVREEQSYSISGIAVPNEDSPPDKEVSSAVKLFLESARRIHSDFVIAGEDMAPVARICHLVQGMPLALILAATWVEVLRPAEIANELERSLDFLEGNLRDLPRRQQSMRAVFDHSWQLLTEPEQEVFRQLSVFRSGFTHEAAQAITRTSLSTLRALINKSLLQQTPAKRYEIHDLLRQYAAEQLIQAPAEAEATGDRHSAYYAAFLYQREADLKGPRQQEALAEIEADGENVRTAWQGAVDRKQIEHLGQALESLALFYLWRGRLFEGEAMCRLATEMLTASSDENVNKQVGLRPSTQVRVQVKILIWLSIFNHDLDQFKRAQQALRQAQTLLDNSRFVGLDTRSERAHLLLEQAKVAMSVNYEEAKHLVEQSLTLYQTLDDLWHRAQGLDLLGEILWRMGGQIDQARRVQNDCLTLRQTIGDARSIARSLIRVGGTARHQGQFEVSEKLMRQGLSIIREIDNQGQLNYALFHLAGTLVHSGKFSDGVLLSKEILKIRDNLGLPDVPIITIGFGLMHLGQYNEAQIYNQRVLKYNREIDDKRLVGYSLKNLGQIALTKGKYNESQKLLQESLAVFRNLRDMQGVGQSLGVLGYVALKLNNRRQAQQYIRENLQIAVETRLFPPHLTALTGVALLLADRAEKDRAVELYALALQNEHVANSRWYEDVAGRQIAAVAKTLPPEVVTAAEERGQSRDLWATAEELLVTLDE